MEGDASATRAPRGAQDEIATDQLTAELTAAVTSMLEPLAILRAVRDATGTIVDFVWVFVNDAGIEALLLPVEAVMGKRLLEVLPEHRDGLFEIYKTVTETGEPYIGHEIGYDDQWGEGEVLPRVFNIRASKAGDGFAVSWNDVTDHVKARHRLVTLNRSLRLHEQIVEGAAEGIWVVDEENRTTYVNAAMGAMLGLSASEMIGANIFDFIDPAVHERIDSPIRNLTAEVGENFEFPLVTHDGETVWTRMTTAPLEGPDGLSLGGFALVTNITDEVLGRRERVIAESMFAQATAHAPIGQALVSLSGEFLEANAALCEIVGYTRDQLIGKTFQEVTHPEDLDADVNQAIALAAGQISSYSMAKRYIRSDGRTIWVQLHASLIRDDQDQPVHFISQVIDIDKERKAEATAANAIQRLAYRSTHDPLTGLPNRSKLLAVLNRSMYRNRDDSITVLFVDIDHFKRVNDGISHSAGDSVLVEVARRVGSCLRDNDLVGRLGGDEFAVVAPGISSTAQALELAERVRATVAARPIDTGGSRIHVSVSVGVARSSTEASPQEVLSRADAALHLAKNRGRNRTQLADVQMIETARARLQLIDRLHDAITMAEFQPWFQPIVDLASGEVIGNEVLARWIQPNSVLAAGSFIDAAEDSGLINPIGQRIINDAIATYAQLRRQDFLALNASPVQLRAPGFAQGILRQLREYDIDCHRVALEITEQSLLVNEDSIISNLREFHEHHVDLYVDDFGTGFSSITTLRDYPIAGIKLDKSFSQLLSKDPQGSIADLVSGLSELATHLRLDRIAEGIEDPECADRLRELGWLRGQGYLFGHAAPLTAMNSTTSAIPTQRPRAVPNPPSTAKRTNLSARRPNRRATDRSA